MDKVTLNVTLNGVRHSFPVHPNGEPGDKERRLGTLYLELFGNYKGLGAVLHGYADGSSGFEVNVDKDSEQFPVSPGSRLDAFAKLGDGLEDLLGTPPEESQETSEEGPQLSEEEREQILEQLGKGLTTLGVLGLIGTVALMIVRFATMRAFIITTAGGMILEHLRKEYFKDKTLEIELPDGAFSMIEKMVKKDLGRELLRAALRPAAKQFCEATQARLIELGVIDEEDLKEPAQDQDEAQTATAGASDDTQGES